MKFSFDWLKELVTVPWSAEETARRLTEIGFETGVMASAGVAASHVVAVKIVGLEKHPNADRLQIARVTDGKREVSIVCGASNITVGQVVPLALPGAKLSGGLEISVSTIRGVESQGMLCSERELGLSEEHAGILQLPANAKLGTELRDVLRGETVFDVDVAPNRPDGLSHVGLARELSALSGKALKLPQAPWKKAALRDRCTVKIEEPKLCSRYLGKIIHNVKVGPSPQWLSDRLTTCGLRPINNIVDITNYVLLEWGHPLHAFDLSKLAKREIVVRRAKRGEKLAALDKRTYELSASDLIIADTEKPVAIAGIMGGQGSGVTEGTTDILLESAVFDRASVRNTSRRLNLKSESSTRFEKGTDAATAEAASNRAARLILELGGGRAGDAADAYPQKEKPKSVLLRAKHLERVVGSAIEPARVKTVLDRLGFRPAKKNGSWSCTVPTYRKDVLEEADLIEEITRMVGYETLPSAEPRGRSGEMPAELRPLDTARITDFLKGLGLDETMTSSFSSREVAQKFCDEGDRIISLTNPLSQEESALRSCVLPQLLTAVKRNIHFQQDAAAFFEIGKRYRVALTSKEPEEKTVLSLVLYGDRQSKDWQTPAQATDYFYVKGVLEALIRHWGVALEIQEPSTQRPFLHPRESFEIAKDGQAVGWGGMLHPEWAPPYDLKAPCAVAELELTGIPVAKREAGEISRYPFVERDIAIAVAKEISWKEILAQVRKGAGPLLKAAHPFDIFSGGSIAAGEKSVAFRVRLQHPDHTLSETEINSTIERIKALLQEHCGAHPR